MSSFTKNHPFIYSFYCIICVLPFVISLPITSKDDPFDKFSEFLSSNNCSMPKEVKLPFSVTDSVPFSYLSYPLNECKTPEAVKDDTEANLLCREVFEVIQNITCLDYKLNNSKIESVKLSNDVCQDFASTQDVIPKQKNFLSSKFQDNIICKVMCTGRFEFLCKTLLWGYNIQAKLKSATLEKNVVTTVQENLENNPDSNEIPDKEIPSMPNDENASDLQKPKKALDTSVNGVAPDAKSKSASADETAKIETKLSASEDKEKSEINEKKTDKIEPQTIDNKKSENLIKASKVIVIPPKAESASKSSSNSSEQIQNIDGKQNQNVTEDKSNDLEENNIEIPSESSSKNDKLDVPPVDVNITASGVATKDEPKEDVDTPKKDETKKVDANDDKEKTKEVTNPTAPKTVEENDQKKSDEENVIGEQGEGKKSQTDLGSKGEDPKENEIPNGESDSNVAEPTMPPIFPDKSDDFEPQPELKDPEQYNESENDGDYAKQEYDTAFNPAPKKESNIKNTLNEGSSQFSSGQISNENYLGHESDMNRNFLPARNYLPDQEDSHFFFYFLTIVLVLMAGYLIFHNKQKIIALIVEGRHERRRRSHGAGYKKLETK